MGFDTPRRDDAVRGLVRRVLVAKYDTGTLPVVDDKAGLTVAGACGKRRGSRRIDEVHWTEEVLLADIDTVVAENGVSIET